MPPRLKYKTAPKPKIIDVHSLLPDTSNDAVDEKPETSEEHARHLERQEESSLFQGNGGSGSKPSAVNEKEIKKEEPEEPPSTPTPPPPPAPRKILFVVRKSGVPQNQRILTPLRKPGTSCVALAQKPQKEPKQEPADEERPSTSDISHLDKMCKSEVKLEEPEVMDIEDSEDGPEPTIGMEIDPTAGCRTTFKCDSCPKAFNSTRAVQRHKEIAHSGHSQTKNYTCVRCNESFHDRSELLIHERIHTTKQFEWFDCEFCPYKTRDSDNLRQHSIGHVINNLLDQPEKTFPCTKCPSTFSTSNKLSRHLEVHNVDRPNSCPYCEYRTVLKDTLRKHINRIHGIKNQRRGLIKQ